MKIFKRFIKIQMVIRRIIPPFAEDSEPENDERKKEFSSVVVVEDINAALVDFRNEGKRKLSWGKINLGSIWILKFIFTTFDPIDKQ